MALEPPPRHGVSSGLPRLRGDRSIPVGWSSATSGILDTASNPIGTGGVGPCVRPGCSLRLLARGAGVPNGVEPAGNLYSVARMGMLAISARRARAETERPAARAGGAGAGATAPGAAAPGAPHSSSSTVDGPTGASAAAGSSTAPASTGGASGDESMSSAEPEEDSEPASVAPPPPTRRIYLEWPARRHWRR